MASLGTLTLDLIAKIGGFTSGLTEAERASKKSADEINKNIESIGVAGYGVGNALGQYIKQGIDTAFNAFPELIEQAAKFQDIADKTGGSSQGFANFAVSAKVAGVSIEAIADASTKLSKNLNGLDDDSKAAGAALKALGIPIADFKKLRPDQQIKSVAEAFGGFADGAGKAAVAQQLFGKSGADLLKFFKDYTDNGGDVTILTSQMIQQADDHADAQTRLRAEIGLFASAASTSFIEPMTTIIGLVKESILQFGGLDGQVTTLGANQGIQNFADNVGRQFAKIADYVKTTKQEFATFDDFGNSLDKALKSFSLKPLAEFQDRHGLDAFFRGKGASIDVANQGLQDAFSNSGKAAAGSFEEAYNQRLAQTRATRNRTLLNAFNYGTGVDARPPLPDSPVTHKGGAGKVDHTAEQEAKSQLAADLDAIKNTQKAYQDAFANNEKILEAMRGAGLTEEGEYYKQKKALLDQNTAVQVDAENQAIARLQQEHLTGKDAIDNSKKIADAQAKLVKIRADAAAQSTVLGIQEESSFKKIANALLSARQAAQDYFDTTARGYDREIAGIGQGSKNRDMQSSISQIEDRYRQQRQDLQNQRSQGELAGTFGPQAAKQFNDQLAIINEFQGKAIDSYKAYYSKLDAAQKDWVNGAKEALSNYFDESQKVADHTQQVFTDAFKGLEDQLTNLFTGKKFDAKSFFESISTELARNAVKEGVTGPLAGWLKGMLGDSGSGGIGSLLGLGKTAAGSVGSAASMAALTASSTGATSAIAAMAAAASSAAVALGGSAGAQSGLGSIMGLFGGSGGAANVGSGMSLPADVLELGGYSSGGFTGSGDANDPAGIVHKGEYVLTAQETASIGVGNLQAGRFGLGGTKIYYQAQPGESRKTASQNGSALAAELARMQRRGS